MKRALLLWVTIAAALVLGGCANQNSSATTGSTSAQRGLVDPGSVAPVSGGPTNPARVPKRFQP